MDLRNGPAPPSPTYARLNSCSNSPSCSDGQTNVIKAVECAAQKHRQLLTMPSAPAIPSLGVDVPSCLPVLLQRLSESATILRAKATEWPRRRHWGGDAPFHLPGKTRSGSMYFSPFPTAPRAV